MNLILLVPELLTRLLYSSTYPQEFYLTCTILVSYLNSLRKVPEEESKLARPNCKDPKEINRLSKFDHKNSTHSFILNDWTNSCFFAYRDKIYAEIVSREI